MDEAPKSGEPVPVNGAGEHSIELGKWIGRREAFCLVAGRCSAADIESLQQIRDRRLYEILNCSWNDFCIKHLHVTRRTVDREIEYLRRFGAAFFTVRQLTRISVKDYESIAGQITDEGVNIDGKLIPMDPENREALENALEKLLEAQPEEEENVPPRPFTAVLGRLRGITRSIRSFEGKPSTEEIRALAEELAAILTAAQSWGIRLAAE